jgi:hypothetical protein
MNRLISGDWQIMASIVLSVAALPLLIRHARRNQFAFQLLFDGWTPLILSMLIASLSGILLERYFKTFTALALLAPIVNGTFLISI